jgi:hypothetical protein
MPCAAIWMSCAIASTWLAVQTEGGYEPVK